jgi:hypothetical protein
MNKYILIAFCLLMTGCYSLPRVRFIETSKGPVQVITAPQYVVDRVCRSIAKERGQAVYLKDNGKPFTAFERVGACADMDKMVIYISEGQDGLLDHEKKHIENGK